VSATGQAAAGEREEAGYYQTIQEFFVARRGDPLFLANADWLLIRKWRRAGIPLRVVLRGITDALDSHAHSWSRKRKVGSLAYCAAEVEAARDRWQRALALDEEPGLSVTATLGSFAEALATARGLGEGGTALAKTLVAELRARAATTVAGRGELEALTSFLADAERRLLGALRADAGAARVLAIESEVEDDLAPYSGRMPARVLDQIRAESIARRLLERHGLPRLSFFHL
jgi:hypothetical protein